MSHPDSARALDRALLDALFRQSAVGVEIFDADRRWIRVNDALARIHGVPAEAHYGKRVRDLLPQADPVVELLQNHVMSTGEAVVDFFCVGRLPGDQEDRVHSVSYSRLEADDGTVLGLTGTIIDVTERHRALIAARAARERLALVNEASARIGTTLDVERTTFELADVAVPAFSDTATVELLNHFFDPQTAPGGPDIRRSIQLVRVASRSGTPRTPRLVRVKEGEPPVAAYPPGEPLHECLVSGEARAYPPGAVPHIPDTDAVILAPLVARGSVLGVATFTRRPAAYQSGFRSSRGVFDADDIEVAEELAARAAICLDNARLYHQERRTALMLQRSLLPEELPAVDGVEVAHRYFPGSVGADVGGDWYDLIPLPGNRVALVVGDVMGSGLRAAGIMGQFRTAVRTLAGLDLTPVQVLHQLDELAASLGEAHLATCVYAVYDPVARTCSMASAGHLPPLLATPDGAVRRVELPPGTPIGVGGTVFEGVEFAIESGSRLILYTDGLVEKRNGDLDQCITELTKKAAELARDGVGLEESCDTVIRAFHGADDYDDATLLIAELRALPAERFASWVLDSQPAVVARARELVRKQLGDWGLAALSDTAELLVSELVTNALRYAEGPIEVRLTQGQQLLCEVADALDVIPRLRNALITDEGGRGLHLVNQLAGRWGTRGTGSGKIVWFELPYPANRLAS